MQSHAAAPPLEGVTLTGYHPGALGRVVEMHGAYYADHWGFGLYFEAKVAREMVDFLERYQEERDGFWVAWAGDSVVGSITVEGSLAATEGARLRWFILAPEARGRGVGKLLMGAAMDFCRRAGFQRVFLWTFARLDAARHLYEQHGFTRCREHLDDQWGVTVTEQMFEWRAGTVPPT